MSENLDRRYELEPPRELAVEGLGDLLLALSSRCECPIITLAGFASGAECLGELGRFG